jgi:hypothetical protein
MRNLKQVPFWCPAVHPSESSRHCQTMHGMTWIWRMHQSGIAGVALIDRARESTGSPWPHCLEDHRLACQVGYIRCTQHISCGLSHNFVRACAPQLTILQNHLRADRLRGFPGFPGYQSQ